ncbi:MAG TPA: GNAT family N-acetyltransferase [Bacteroidia bacterium]|jgi:ribosomal-protein-alanine N-acetyltransferase|nr:GNAT family N-acetyltransferase [Bacteroidia bacterium]
MLTPNFTPFPVITTERLVLRQMTKDDANDLFRIRSDKRVNEYLVRIPSQSVDDVIAFITKLDISISNNESIIWGITLKDENKVIGTICIWNLKKEHDRAEVGYELYPDYWRKGIMQEALSAILDYGFNVMKLHSIAAIIDPFNEGSYSLLEKNRFVKEAHFKEDYFHHGKFQDTVIYSLLSPNRALIK